MRIICSSEGQSILLIMNVLFLETHSKEGSTYLKDVIFAISAGAAMIVATAVAVWAGHRWSTTSLPFILAIVIGYMVKDRIKDWLKLISTKKMTGWLSDYKTNIKDPETGKKIGLCKEAVSYIPEKRVAKNVMALRNKGVASSRFSLPQDVIKYEKEISLKPRLIYRTHSRLRDVTDIIRFNVMKFLERMDEPFEVRKIYDVESGEIKKFESSRVYYVNLILKLGEQMHRVRLVLNREGIKRVEEV